MATAGLGSPERGDVRERLDRFDGVERVAHWLTALSFLTLIFTGAALYIPALVGLVGRRVLITRIHVDVGLALPLPLLVSLAGSWGRGLRADIRTLNRWTHFDRQWLRNVRRHEPTTAVPTGKFNAGQKLNAAFVLGVMLVMLMTGSVMHWFNLFSNSWRTGATFVHDLFAYFIVAVVIGHIFMAVTHPEALRSIFTGKVSRKWAQRHASLWLEELDAPPPTPGGRVAKARARAGVAAGPGRPAEPTGPGGPPATGGTGATPGPAKPAGAGTVS